MDLYEQIQNYIAQLDVSVKQLRKSGSNLEIEEV